mgnify:CR=1 FL=1
MGDILGTFLAGTIFLMLVALGIYVIGTNSALLTVVGLCALAGGGLGYALARIAGRPYSRKG